MSDRDRRWQPAGVAPAAFLLFIWIFVSQPLADAQMPAIPASNVSEAAFARAIVPALLGRPARGVEEISLIAEISERLGREAVVRMLMQEQEFVTHWTDLMVDILRVNRENLLIGQAPECFGEPLRDQDDGGTLAAFVRDNPPQTSTIVAEYNMIDLVRSAIQLDDLSPVYRAYLFPMSSRRYGLSEAVGQQHVADQFLQSYLNREIGCLGCHNRTFSVSNKEDDAGDIVWRRLWAIPVNIEKALFGNYYGADGRLQALFRRDPSDDSGFVPWNMRIECSSDIGPADDQGNRELIYGHYTVPPLVPRQPETLIGLDGSTNPNLTVVHLEHAFHSGVDALAVNGLVPTITPPVAALSSNDLLFCDFVNLMRDSCAGCHPGYRGEEDHEADLDIDGNPAFLMVDTDRVVPGDREESGLYQLVTSGTNYPYNVHTLSDADVEIVGDWIDAGAPNSDPDLCGSSHVPDVEFEPALAFQVAVNAVDQIWATVTGRQLTIDHGFARNEAQLDTLWYLTEDVFIPGQWSLGDILVTIMTSDGFLRRAPADAGAGPYALPMLWDPWIEADPTEPPPNDPLGARAHNGPGDLTHRRAAGSRVSGGAIALDWYRPTRYPDIQDWHFKLARSMGRHESPKSPGFGDVDFQSLLHWDDTVGICSKSGRTDDLDWIDRVVARVSGFDASHSTAPLSYGDAYLIVKDWLIQDPTMSDHLPTDYAGVADALTEQQAVLALFNAELPAGSEVTLDTPASRLGDDYLETKLREVCGVFLKSPEFMLTQGIPEAYTTGMPEAPRMRVCNDDDCDRPAMCEQFRGDLEQIGRTIYCIDGAISLQPPPHVTPGPIQLARESRQQMLLSLCPRDRCAFLPWKKVAACEKRPSLCREPPIPLCDFRCNGLRCCGEIPANVGTPGLLSIRAAGASVLISEGVSVAPAGSEIFGPLQSRATLRAGDILQVPMTARLAVEVSRIRFGTPVLPDEAIDDPAPNPLLPGRPVATSAQPITRPSDPFGDMPAELSRDEWVQLLEKLRATLAALQQPVYISVTGPRRSGFQTRDIETIDRMTLRAEETREAFLSRAPSPQIQRRLDQRAARFVSNPVSYEVPDGLALHPLPSTAEETATNKQAIEVSVRFTQGTAQSIFCPGIRPVRCNEACRIVLPEPSSCGVVGVVSSSKVSGRLPVKQSGSQSCAWRGAALACNDTDVTEEGRIAAQ